MYCSPADPSEAKKKNQLLLTPRGAAECCVVLQYSINGRNTPALPQRATKSHKEPISWFLQGEQGVSRCEPPQALGCIAEAVVSSYAACRANEIPASTALTQFWLLCSVLQCCPCAPRAGREGLPITKGEGPGQRGWGAWAIPNDVCWAHRLWLLARPTLGSFTLKRQPQHPSALIAISQGAT